MRSVYFQTKSIRTTGGTESISQNYHTTLFHELGHGFANNVFNASVLNAAWVKDVQTERGVEDVSKSEVFASMVENMLRAEQGLNLKTDKIDLDVDLDITVGESSAPVIGPMPNDGNTPILGEHDIERAIPNLGNLSDGENAVVSVGAEGTLGFGGNISLDAVLFQNQEGVVDAVGVLKTTGDTVGLYGGGGVQAGVMLSTTGGSLSFKNFEGSSTSYSIGVIKGGATFINSGAYRGIMVDIPGAGNSAGISRSTNTSEIIGGSKNIVKYYKN